MYIVFLLNQKIKFIYTEEVLKKRVNYLNNEYLKKNKYNLKEKLFGIKYKMINKVDLDNMYNDCIKFIEYNINKLEL